MDTVNRIKFVNISTMKKALLMLLISPLFVMCGEEPENEGHNYTVADYSAIPPMGISDTVKVILSPGGGEDTYIETNYYGYDFKLVINSEGDTVRFVTHDAFVTPEGYTVGTRWADIPLEKQTEVERIKGYGYFLKLASGWKLGFCAGSECANEDLSEDSRVVWIEK